MEGGSGDFFERIPALIEDLGGTNGPTLLLGLTALTLILVLKRVAPLVPGSLIAVVPGIVASTALDPEAHGVEVVGGIEAGLPSLGFPDVGLGDLGLLVAGSPGVLLVAFAEGPGAAKTYAARDHHEIDANRGRIGLGPPGWEPGCPVAWSSTAASRRPPSTGRRAPAPNSPGSSRPS